VLKLKELRATLWQPSSLGGLTISVNLLRRQKDKDVHVLNHRSHDGADKSDDEQDKDGINSSGGLLGCDAAC